MGRGTLYREKWHKIRTEVRKLKILKSLFVVLAMVAIVAGATSAYFSDNKIVAGNTFSSGTLDIVYGGSASTAITLGNMVPGDWYGDQAYPGGDYKLTVNNSGSGSTMTAKYRFRSLLTSTDTVGLYGKIKVKVSRHEMVGANHLWVNYYNGPLSGMLVDSSLAAVMANLPPGNSHDWQFAYQLDPFVDNTYQGQSVTFTLFADATQASNPGW